MLRGLLVLSLFFLFCLGQDWPCQFQFGDNYYDLTPGNSNPNSTDGLWHTVDTNNDYYFKLCEETTSIPQGTSMCSAGTQVCEKDFFAHIYSCGVNPVTSAYETGSGKGVVMYASGGRIDGCTQGRQSYLEVLCPKGTGYSSGTFGPVTEKQACVYTFPFYHDVGCPTNSPASQSDALIAIYQSTDGANWKDNTNWLSLLDPTGCNWYGVECDSNNAVTQLRLFENGLVGTIPSELSGLTMAENILLQNNSLSGTVPDLSAFKLLKNLYLSGNMLSGSFPNITTLSSLVEIDIHSNKMTGVVPSNLCDIDYFNVKDNDWICPFPSCCLSAINEKTRCGSCQWTNI